MRRLRIETPDVVGRRRAERRGERIDRVEHALDAAEGQRGGAEADDLLIARRAVAAHDLHRVGRGVLAVVGLVETIQPRAERLRRT
jgi:hypothetical protein